MNGISNRVESGISVQILVAAALLAVAPPGLEAASDAVQAVASASQERPGEVASPGEGEEFYQLPPYCWWPYYYYCEYFSFVDLDVDTDRDGTVENLADDPQEEQWSKTRGAVFLNNVDDDDNEDDADNPRKADNKDNAIDGNADRRDLAELMLRARRGPLDRLTLIIDGQDASKVRIFDENGVARLGVTAGGVVRRYRVPNPGPRVEVTYLVEGLDFPNANWKYLDLRLLLQEVDSVPISDRVRLRIAPYIMLANPEPAEEVYFEFPALGGGVQFSNDVDDELNAAQSDPYLDLVYNDQWTQDEFEIGFTLASRSRMHVTWDLPRDDDLDPFPEIELLDPELGHYVLPTARRRVSADFGGNIEVSFRPVTAAGRLFRFGRAIVGSNADQAIKDFLSDQEVQAPIIELNVNWLDVGHVDEVMNIAPGRSLIVADTAAAWRALVQANNAGNGNRQLFVNSRDAMGNRLDTRIRDLVSNDPNVMLPMPDGTTRNAREFRAAQRRVQRRLDQIRVTLVGGLAPARTIRVPTLFTTATDARAYLPNAVNALIANGKYIAPQQFAPTLNPADGDFLEKQIADLVGAAFGGAGNVVFVDDFENYFLNGGDVHCGTNVRRTIVNPPPAWWDQVEP